MRGFLILLAVIVLCGSIAHSVRKRDRSISNGLYFVTVVLTVVMLAAFVSGEL